MPNTVLDQSLAEAAPTNTAGAPLTSVGETLASIQDEVLIALQNRSDVASNLPLLTRWINRGYVNTAQMIDIKELWSSLGYTTVADQPFYLVPDALSWIKRLNLEDETDEPFTGGGELELIDEGTYRTLPDSDVLSQVNPLLPAAYFRWSRMLVLWPTPSGEVDLSMDFRVRPLPLVDPTDSPILPPEFHEAIIFAGVERAWRSLGVPAKAAIAANDKLTILRPLLNSDAEERDAMHMSLTPTRSLRQLYRRWRP